MGALARGARTAQLGRFSARMRAARVAPPSLPRGLEDPPELRGRNIMRMHWGCSHSHACIGGQLLHGCRKHALLGRLPEMVRRTPLQLQDGGGAVCPPLRASHIRKRILKKAEVAEYSDSRIRRVPSPIGAAGANLTARGGKRTMLWPAGGGRKGGRSKRGSTDKAGARAKDRAPVRARAKDRATTAHRPRREPKVLDQDGYGLWQVRTLELLGVLEAPSAVVLACGLAGAPAA